MNELSSTPTGKAFNLAGHIEYADGSVVSET
jgi:hypothetical protein